MVATVAPEEIAGAFPAAAEPVGRVAVVVAAVAGAAVAIIRRVTPVLPAARGCCRPSSATRPDRRLTPAHRSERLPLLELKPHLRRPQPVVVGLHHASPASSAQPGALSEGMCRVARDTDRAGQPALLPESPDLSAIADHVR